MTTLFRRPLPRLILCLVVLLQVLLPPTAFAQFYDESLEDQQFFEDRGDNFFESDSDQFGTPSQEQDFTEGNEYVDEQQVPPSQRNVPASAEGRQVQLALTGDKQQLPLNVAWGAGTGLLIGGWIALIQEGNNRETQRAIGTGIVLGIFLGAAVGLRAVIDPNAPRAVGDAAPAAGHAAASLAANDGPRTGSTAAEAPSRFTPLVSLNPSAPSFGFRFSF